MSSLRVPTPMTNTRVSMYMHGHGHDNGYARVLIYCLLLLTISIIGIGSINGAPVNETFFAPSQCDLTTRTCCPKHNGAICGGIERGECVDVIGDDNVCDTTYLPSLWWFANYYTNACVCGDRFVGVACERCFPGWTGDNCTQVLDLSVRRNFAHLSTAEKTDVITAFTLSKEAPSLYQPDVSVFDFFAATHAWAARLPHLVMTHLQGHGGPALPTWHRLFLMSFERELQRITHNVNFALPYWAWTDSTGNDNDEVLRWFGGDGDPKSLYPAYTCRQPTNDGWGGCNCSVTRGQFAGWSVIGLWGVPREGHVISRAFGCWTRMAPSLPTADVMEYLIGLKPYYSNDTEAFAPYLVGLPTQFTRTHMTWPEAEDGTDMHSRVHRWVGGSMSDKSYNPSSDPLFYLLHNYVDLIFERWIRNTNPQGTDWPTQAPEGHHYRECLGPFVPLQMNKMLFVHSRSLGYTFDFFNDANSGVLPRQSIKKADHTTHTNTNTHHTTHTSHTAANGHVSDAGRHARDASVQAPTHDDITLSNPSHDGDGNGNGNGNDNDNSDNDHLDDSLSSLLHDNRATRGASGGSGSGSTKNIKQVVHRSRRAIDVI